MLKAALLLYPVHVPPNTRSVREAPQNIRAAWKEIRRDCRREPDIKSVFPPCWHLFAVSVGIIPQNGVSSPDSNKDPAFPHADRRTRSRRRDAAFRTGPGRSRRINRPPLSRNPPAHPGPVSILYDTDGHYLLKTPSTYVRMIFRTKDDYLVAGRALWVPGPALTLGPVYRLCFSSWRRPYQRSSRTSYHPTQDETPLVTSSRWWTRWEQTYTPGCTILAASPNGDFRLLWR